MRRWWSALCIAVTVGAGLFVGAGASQASVFSGPSTLRAGQRLTSVGRLVSPSGQFVLTVEGGLLMMTQIGNGGGNLAYSGADTWDRDFSSSIGINAASYLTVQTDGNLVLYTPRGKAVWSTRTNGRGAGAYLTAQNDGNLVLYNGAGRPLWDTGAGRVMLGMGEKLLPGQSLISRYPSPADANPPSVLTMQTDGNLVLYAMGKAQWATHTSTRGSYLLMQSDGNLVIYGPTGRAVWSTQSHGASGSSLQMNGCALYVLNSVNPPFIWDANIPSTCDLL